MTAPLGALAARPEGGGAIRFGAPTQVFSGSYPCCFEPSVAVDRKGRVFVTNAAGAAIAVSSDDGAHFTQRRVPPELVGQNPLEAVPDPLRGPPCICDAIVQVDPRGRLVYSTLAEAGIQVAVSSDAAKSWESNTVIRTALRPDRQWLGFGAKDTVYVIWHSGTSLRVIGRPDLGTSPAFFTAISLDGGRTFGPPQPFLPGTEIFVAGPPVVDAAGRVYVPFLTGYYTGRVVSPAIAVAVSPGGVLTTFVAHRVAASPCFCGFPIAAVDPRGTTTVAFNGFAGGHTDVAHARAFVSRSTDHGLSWSRPRQWSEQIHAGPWIQLRGDRADMLWYGDDLMLTRGAPDGSSSRRTRVGSASAQTDFPHFAYLRDGRVIAVFSRTSAVYAAIELPVRSQHSR